MVFEQWGQGGAITNTVSIFPAQYKVAVVKGAGL